eukprot:scaffold635_cov311-Pinguiococcus_pyrenoidosus.AAC.8
MPAPAVDTSASASSPWIFLNHATRGARHLLQGREPKLAGKRSGQKLVSVGARRRGQSQRHGERPIWEQLIVVQRYAELRGERRGGDRAGHRGHGAIEAAFARFSSRLWRRIATRLRWTRALKSANAPRFLKPPARGRVGSPKCVGGARGEFDGQRPVKLSKSDTNEQAGKGANLGQLVVGVAVPKGGCPTPVGNWSKGSCLKRMSGTSPTDHGRPLDIDILGTGYQ